MLPDFVACDLSLLGIQLNHCGGHFCSSVLDRRSIGKLAGKLVKPLEMGARKGMRNHVHDCNNEAHPPIVLARASVALHISLYKTAKHVEPQLYLRVLRRLLK